MRSGAREAWARLKLSWREETTFVLLADLSLVGRTPDGSYAMDSIADAVGWVKTAGEIASEEQWSVSHAARTYKRDDSIITESDKKVEDYLFGKLAEAYPEANILAEESVRQFDRGNRARSP